MIFTWGLLQSKTSGIAGVTKKVIKALAQILEGPGTMEEVGAPIPLSKVVNIKKEKELAVVAHGIVAVEEERASAPIPTSEIMISEPTSEHLPSI